MAYTIEEEQEINEIKNWWKENAKSIIVMVVLALAGNFGWRYWQEHQITHTQEVSAEYEQVIHNGDTKDAVAQTARIDAFVQANDRSAYAVMALLNKAKLAVENKDFPLAETALKQAVAQAPDDIFASLAALRLTGVQIQQQQFDAALESLKLVKDQTWDSRKKMLTGDILLAKGDKEGAKASFQQAQQNADQLEQRWLQVRLNNL